MPDKPCRILIVDDDELWIQLVQFELSRNGYELQYALNAHDGLQLAAALKPQVVITDLMMPDVSGTEFCRQLKDNPHLYPLYIIMVTAKDSSYSQASNLHIGADVYLIKPIKMSELRAHIQVGLRWVASQEKLKELATLDSLTTLANRYALDQVLEQKVAEALAQNTPLSLILLDLDDFKTINDTYGHPVGDRTLQELAKIIRRHVSKGVAARYGGEEFVIILPEVEYEQALRLAESLRQAVAATLWPAVIQSYAETPLKLDNIHQMTASFGVASFQRSSMRTADELLRVVDDAAYQAKRGGKNRIYPPPDSTQESLLSLQVPTTFDHSWAYAVLEWLNPTKSLLDPTFAKHLTRILEAQAGGVMRWTTENNLELIGYARVSLEVATQISHSPAWHNFSLSTDSLHDLIRAVPVEALNLKTTEGSPLITVIAAPALGSTGQRLGGMWLAWSRQVRLGQDQKLILLWLVRLLGLELEIKALKEMPATP